MDWQVVFTLALLAFLFVVMMRGIAPPDMVLWGGAVMVTLFGIISPAELLSGLSEPAVVTIGALFVISAAMRETGALDIIGRRFLGSARSERALLARLLPQVPLFSAFLNNTAVVAMYMSLITDWCRKHHVSPSRLLLPLAMLSIAGGMCTLIGTSINLVVDSLMVEAGMPGLHMFEMAWIGVPAMLVTMAYVYFVAPRLLPDRKDLLEHFGEATREYLVEMRVEPNCPLVGKTVEEAGLRRLPGLFLIEIDRSSRIIAPVEPDQMILAGDRLTFAGVVSTIVDLERIHGLVPAGDENYETDAAKRRSRRYCEAVISNTSPLVGKSVREANFRARYNAAVLAVHRGGERLKGRIGDIVLRAGDTLLLQTGPNFVAANRNNPDFYLVSSIEEARPVRHERAWIALSLLAVLVLLLAFGGRFGWNTAVVGLLVAGMMIITRCISPGDARRSVNLTVLLTIAAAFALAKALENSGAAGLLGRWVVLATQSMGIPAAMALLYGVTIAFNMMVTSNATAALIFPVAMAVAAQLGADARPFAILVAHAAVASFASPVAYQVNVMIYGPGGYRFRDFLRVGLPLHGLLWILAVVLIPRIWPA